MDYSALTEAQQQAQAQQHYHTQQQQQQQPAYAQPLATDPNQAYAPQNQAYYPHYQPYPQAQNAAAAPQQQYYQQHYPYYQPEYAAQTANPATAAAAASAAPVHASYQQQVHSDANLQPPGLDYSGHSQNPVPAAVPQQNAYYPQPAAEQQQHGSFSGGPRLTPAAAAAAAALSQLSQLAGSVDAAGRAMAAGYQDPWHGKKGQMGQPTVIAAGNNGPMLTIGGSPSPFRGGGRRGGAPFRGGGRRGFNNRHSGPDMGAPPAFRGRGRMGGRGGGGGGGGRRNPRPPAQEPGFARVPRAPKVAWCPLCSVDCNTDEILQQHFNGKRHKKNLQKAEEEQARNQRKNNSGPYPKFTDHPHQPQQKLMDQPENVQEAEEKKASEPENLPAGTGTIENKAEAEQVEPVEPVEQVEQPENSKVEPTEALGQKPKPENFMARKRNLKKRPGKRNFTDFRRGKRFKPSVGEAPSQPTQPMVCSFCNVKCDTQQVLDAHLAGKRHAARIKRFPGQEVVFGSSGLQAFLVSQPPPAVITPQGQQPIVYAPQDQQPVVYEHQAPQVAPEPQMQQTVHGDEGSQAGQEHQVPQACYAQEVQEEPQAQEMVLEPANEQAATELEEQKQTVLGTEEHMILGSEPNQVLAPDTVGPESGNGAPAASDHVFPATEDAVSGSEYAAIPGLEIEAKETISNVDVPPTVTEMTD